MRKMSFWWAYLCSALVLLLPQLAKAQDATGYFPPDWNWPLPFSNNPEQGGLFLSSEFVMYRQTNPLKNQWVATRGFVDTDGGVIRDLTGGAVVTPGTHFGSGTLALQTDQVSGPNDYQPGTKIEIGWKFGNGAAVSVDWTFISEHKLFASATALPFNNAVGPELADSFLYSPVYGFPNDYSGNFGPNAGGARKMPLGNPLSAYGIWNGASIETIEFLQRVQQYEITYRDVIFETENFRTSYTVGPRFFWIWEKFNWVTNDLDTTGMGGPLDTAIYTNVVSNRMYGAFCGISNECYLGHGFALQTDFQAAALLDCVREKAQYTTGAKDGVPQVTAESKRTITVWNAVPELNGSINLVWYPIQSVQLRIGYNAMAFLNTISSPTPIDFNYGSVNPVYQSTFRLFDGLNVGIAFLF